MLRLRVGSALVLVALLAPPTAWADSALTSVSPSAIPRRKGSFTVKGTGLRSAELVLVSGSATLAGSEIVDDTTVRCIIVPTRDGIIGVALKGGRERLGVACHGSDPAAVLREMIAAWGPLDAELDRWLKRTLAEYEAFIGLLATGKIQPAKPRLTNAWNALGRAHGISDRLPPQAREGYTAKSQTVDEHFSWLMHDLAQLLLLAGDGGGGGGESCVTHIEETNRRWLPDAVTEFISTGNTKDFEVWFTGGDRPRHIVVRLRSTRHAGACNNYRTSEEWGRQRDIAIEPKRNTDWVIVDGYQHLGRVALTVKALPPDKRVTISVSSFDWGGTGAIVAQAEGCEPTAEISFPRDTDRDGLPDVWEDRIQDAIFSIPGGLIRAFTIAVMVIDDGEAVSRPRRLLTGEEIFARRPRFSKLERTSNAPYSPNPFAEPDPLWDRDPYPVAGEGESGDLVSAKLNLPVPDNWALGKSGDGRSGFDEYRGEYVLAPEGISSGIVHGDSPLRGVPKAATLRGLMLSEPIAFLGRRWVHVRTDPTYKDHFILADDAELRGKKVPGMQRLQAKKWIDAHLAALPLHIYKVSRELVADVVWTLPVWVEGVPDNKQTGPLKFVTLTRVVNAHRAELPHPDYGTIDALPGPDLIDPTPYQRASAFAIVGGTEWGESPTETYGRWRVFKLRLDQGLPGSPNEMEISFVNEAKARAAARAGGTVFDRESDPFFRYMETLVGHEGAHQVAIRHHPRHHLMWTELRATLQRRQDPPPFVLWRTRRSATLEGDVGLLLTADMFAAGLRHERENAAAAANDLSSFVLYEFVDLSQIRLHLKHR